MEEEDEEVEEETQDSEYDGYEGDGYSDEEDRALRNQFIEPLFDVSHLPKTPSSFPIKQNISPQTGLNSTFEIDQSEDRTSSVVGS